MVVLCIFAVVCFVVLPKIGIAINSNNINEKPKSTVLEAPNTQTSPSAQPDMSVQIAPPAPPANVNFIKNLTTGVSYDDFSIAVNAARPMETLQIFVDGTYKLPAITNNITINKDPNANVVLDCTGDPGTGICPILQGCTFEGLTINMGQTSYHGFQDAGTIIMNQCVINGLFFTYNDMTFNGCTFNQDSPEYMTWAYAGNLNFKNCLFNGQGKFINAYNEGIQTPYTLSISGCTFNSSVINKSAINLKCVCGLEPLHFNVQIDNTNTTNENFPTDKRLNNPLIMIDDGNSSTINVEFIERHNDGTESIKNAYPPSDSFENIEGAGENLLDASELYDSSFVGEPEEPEWTVTQGSEFVQITPNTGCTCTAVVKEGYADHQIVVDATMSSCGVKKTFNINFPKFYFHLQGLGEDFSQGGYVDRSNVSVRPADPIAPDVKFAYWCTDAQCTSEPYTFEEPINSNIDLYANWVTPEPEQCVVTFDANGGIGTMEPQEFVKNTPKALFKNVFIKEGYSFIGWATSPGGSVVYKDEEVVMFTTDTVLFAVWDKNYGHVKISLNFEGGTETPVKEIYAIYKKGYFKDAECTQKLTKLDSVPAKEGFVFVGFFTQKDNKNKNGIQITDKDGNIVDKDCVWFGEQLTTNIYACWISIVPPQPEPPAPDNPGSNQNTMSDIYSSLLQTSDSLLPIVCGVVAIIIIGSVIIALRSRD